MDDNYNAGYEAGRTGMPPSGGEGFAYSQGYVEGKRAGESREGPPGVGIGILALSFALCWLYPMVGASVAVVGLVFYLGADTFPRFVLIALLLLAIVAWFFGFKLERRVSRFKAYRILRDCIRWAVGLYPFVAALGAPARNAPTGGYLVLYLLIFVFCFWLVKRADRVMGFRG
jgi:hypothetical protein